MALSLEEQVAEKEYLELVLGVINDIITQTRGEIDTSVIDILERKKYLWTNKLDPQEIASGIYEVNLEVGRGEKKIAELALLERSRSKPYFGRINFVDEHGESVSVYIGINGIYQGKSYVIDWRAPISSLFYNYGVGQASYISPSGKVNGEIVGKWQYTIENGKLIQCVQVDGPSIDDQALRALLSGHSADKMKNIVESIQSEQNGIIRNTSDKYIIVQGAAGSGKTSVALHRIAYLLYQEANLKSSDVLIFSPNEVFSDYISEVLPDLGEENVLQATFADFAKTVFSDYNKIESFAEFIERYYKCDAIFNDEAQAKIIKYKLSDDFIGMIDKHLAEFEKSVRFKNGVKLGQRTLSCQELNMLLHERFSDKPFFTRLDFIAEYICNHFKLKKSAKSTIIKKLSSILVGWSSVEGIYSSIISSDEFRTCSGTSFEGSVLLGKKTLLQYEDLLPMMYIYYELNGYPKNRRIKHVIIDEAQDYTKLQLQILKNIFEKSSFTILGDVNQTINPYYIYGSLSDIGTIFSGGGSFFELPKSYRSSGEIIQYANSILSTPDVHSVRGFSDKPVIFRTVDNDILVSQLLDDIRILQNTDMRRIAIITKSSDEATNLYEQLKQHLPDINILSEAGKGVISGVVILPSYVAKGLEFDGIIACSSDEEQYQEKDKNLYYVVCTRALHSLIVYNEPSFLERFSPKRRFRGKSGGE